MIKAELRKLVLPANVLALTGALAISGLLAFAKAGLAPVVYAQAGFIVLGVLAVTSEYQGRQIYVTLTVMPRRILQYLSKLVAVLIVAAPVAGLVALVSGVAYEAVGYLLLTALISASVASVVRRSIPAVAGLLIYYFILGPLLHDRTSLPDSLGYLMWTMLAVGISTALFHLRDA